MFLQLTKMKPFEIKNCYLQPFGITRFYGWMGAYQRHLDKHEHIIGKSNTQTIEPGHLTLRTKLNAARHICEFLRRLDALTEACLSTAMSLNYRFNNYLSTRLSHDPADSSSESAVRQWDAFLQQMDLTRKKKPSTPVNKY